MPLNVGFRIRAFFSPLLRALGMSSYSSPPYFEWHTGSDSNSVRTYSKLLELHYLKAGAERMKVMRVTELRLVKQLGKHSKHEYIVACVKTPNGKTRYMSIERLRDTRAVAPASQSDSMLTRTSSKRQSLSSVSPSSPSTSKSSLDSFNKRSNALDVVRSMDEPLHKLDDCVLGTLKFTGARPFYLYELAVLAETIHDSQRCYQLLYENCYWFAGMLMSILEYDYGLKFEVKNGVVKQGTWQGFQITPGPPADLSAITNEFRENVKIFQEKVAEPTERERRLEETAESDREQARERERILREAVEREREAKEAVERERERMLKWMREQGIQVPI